MSPKDFPDWSNMIERTIASSRSGSTSTSWNTWRRSPSVRDSVRHLATARPGLLAGISCDKLSVYEKGLVAGSKGLTKPREVCCMHMNCESPCTNLRDLRCIPSRLRVAKVRAEGAGEHTRCRAQHAATNLCT